MNRGTSRIDLGAVLPQPEAVEVRAGGVGPAGHHLLGDGLDNDRAEGVISSYERDDGTEERHRPGRWIPGPDGR